MSELSTVAAFDLAGPLPEGTTVLEASAGTGKTFAIAALATRYIAEGITELDSLMLVTFGRNATNELRTRVRERLGETERYLARRLAGELADDGGDPVLGLLACGDTAEIRRRHRRIARAIADFDSATIATTHEFCQQMLAGLGVLGDFEPNANFVESLSELAREVASDCYLRQFAGVDRQPPFSHEDALRIADQVVDFGDGPLVPPLTPEESDANARVTFATSVRAEVQLRKAKARLFTYDDMLTRLHSALAAAGGEAAATRLRTRYRIVLVDEFQDTDPVQWDILRRAFHGHSTLILIGDPKQAIYAFRGADVYSYLDAVQAAGSISTLATNWRSDRVMVQALDVLFGGAALGDDKIVVRQVEAHHEQRRLALADGAEPGLGAPVRMRIVPHDPDADRLPSVGQLRPMILKDLVADIAITLQSGTRLVEPEHPSGRPLTPGDIAVLVRTNNRGEEISTALSAAGIPSVLLGSGSVFSSDIANQWLTLLKAMEQPRQARIRAASLTCFFGWDFTRLAMATDDDLTELSQTVRTWSKTLAAEGVAALLESIVSSTGLNKRLLAEVGGERKLTDLRHIAQSLHAAMVHGQLGVVALVEWLRERISEAGINSLTEQSRRLETDNQAVQILTVHRSKGLEFPIVYLPDAWDRHVAAKDEGLVLRLHDQQPDGRLIRVQDVGGARGIGRTTRLTQARREDSGEDLRLLYVALTRAKCQVVAWWAPSWNTANSALQRFLFGPLREGVEPEPRYEVNADPFTLAQLPANLFSLERLVPRRLPQLMTTTDSVGRLGVRTFARQLDTDWRRTSYSSLTAAVHGLDLASNRVSSEAEIGKADDESMVAPLGLIGGRLPDHDRFAEISPMNELPSGAAFGTIVHAILEAVDPQSSDLEGALRAAAEQELQKVPAGLFTAEGLAKGLLPSMQTPLGPLAHSLRLCDLSLADRLAELDFEFPLAGGDEPQARVTLGHLAPLLRRHLGSDDPLADYPDRIAHPQLAGESLRGYLNGSIDAVLRVRDAVGAPSYLVVDYKTNWLGDFDGAPLTLGHYVPDLMAEAMMHAHYPLQALLYSVALHRLLRWRQPDYRPHDHLGGVLYLFVRGMGGSETPTVEGIPCGVFSWKPPAELIIELSDLLECGEA